MELSGKVHLVGQTESVGSNGFTKRQLVIKTEEQYSQTIPIDFVKEKTSLLDNVSQGQNVKVFINIRGNEYNGKFFVNLQGWRIEKTGDAAQQPATQTEPEGDGLPF